MPLLSWKADQVARSLPAFTRIGLRSLLDTLINANPGTPAFTVGAEASNAIATTIQLKDADGNDLAVQREITLWISDTARGVPSATAPDGTVSVSTGTLLKTDTTKVLHRVLCNTSGQIVISVGESTAKSFYVCVSDNGKTASQVITFA